MPQNSSTIKKICQWSHNTANYLYYICIYYACRNKTVLSKHNRDSSHSQYKTLHSGDENGINRDPIVRTSRNIEFQSANSHKTNQVYPRGKPFAPKYDILYLTEFVRNLLPFFIFHIYMATSNFSLPTFPPFDAHADGNTGQCWKKWLSRFERLLVAMNIEEKKQQRAMLLHFAGPAVDEIFETLPDTGEAKDYDKAVEALNTYFIPQVNTAYEEYNFRETKQRDNETLGTYHTRLRHLSQNCSFADVVKEIKNQIIISCSSQKLRRRALRDNPTLKELLDAGRAEETSQAQVKTVEKQQSFQGINAVTSARAKDNP